MNGVSEFPKRYTKSSVPAAKAVRAMRPRHVSGEDGMRVRTMGEMGRIAEYVDKARRTWDVEQFATEEHVVGQGARPAIAQSSADVGGESVAALLGRADAELATATSTEQRLG